VSEALEISADDYDVDEPAKVRKRRNKVKFRDEVQAAELSDVLATYSGRAVLWRIVSECGVYSVSTACDNSVFLNEGKRFMGIWLLNEINRINPGAYAVMHNEDLERKKVDA